MQGNIGKDEGCPLCGEADTTEHVFTCEGSNNFGGVTVKDLEDGSRMREIEEIKSFKKCVRYTEQKSARQLVCQIYNLLSKISVLSPSLFFNSSKLVISPSFCSLCPPLHIH